jgi:hypothetical protein
MLSITAFSVPPSKSRESPRECNGIGFLFDPDSFRVEAANCEETATVTDPDVLAHDIAEDLEAAREQFREIAVDLGGEVVEPEKS